MAFRIGRTRAQHSYPEPRSIAGSGSSVGPTGPSGGPPGPTGPTGPSGGPPGPPGPTGPSGGPPGPPGPTGPSGGPPGPTGPAGPGTTVLANHQEGSFGVPIGVSAVTGPAWICGVVITPQLLGNFFVEFIGFWTRTFVFPLTTARFQLVGIQGALAISSPAPVIGPPDGFYENLGGLPASFVVTGTNTVVLLDTGLPLLPAPANGQSSPISLAAYPAANATSGNPGPAPTPAPTNFPAGLGKVWFGLRLVSSDGIVAFFNNGAGPNGTFFAQEVP